MTVLTQFVLVVVNSVGFLPFILGPGIVFQQADWHVHVVTLQICEWLLNDFTSAIGQ
jgi:hypothetical protein